eukprot:6848184-Pyramimonas_sp.AAC.1
MARSNLSPRPVPTMTPPPGRPRKWRRFRSSQFQGMARSDFSPRMVPTMLAPEQPSKVATAS